MADQVPSVDGYIISHSPATNPNSPLNHCNTLSEHALFLAAHHSKEKEKIRNSEAENCLFRQKNKDTLYKQCSFICNCADNLQEQ